METSHISVAASVEQMDVDSAGGHIYDTPTLAPRVVYAGSVLLKHNADLTPCKFHRNTPPMPVPAHGDLREILSQKI